MDIYHGFTGSNDLTGGVTSGSAVKYFQFLKPSKAIMFTTVGAGFTVDLYTYTASGITETNTVRFASGSTNLLPVKVWGISLGVTGSSSVYYYLLY
jgi:hypothetical protein